MTDQRTRTGLRAVAVTAAALAVGMGIGRFVFTPILPLMVDEAGLTASGSAALATANYVGYFIGAAIGIVAPSLVRSQLVFRVSLLVIVASLVLMPVSTSMVLWSVLRLFSGIGSALMFMYAVASLFAQLGPTRAHLSGWGFGGVGAGIALSGALVMVIRSFSTWSVAWIASGVLGALLALVSWKMPPAPLPQAAHGSGARASTGRWFGLLLVSYTLEGVGYIIAGTFLVAAVGENAGPSAGSGSWIIVGLAAFPSAALWSWLSARYSRPSVLTTALLVQAVGVTIPAFIDGSVAALVSAALFGGTFLGIANMSLAIGDHLQFPRAVAILTTGYSVGQIVGPLVVAPLLDSGYQSALIVGGVVLLVAAGAGALLRIGFPARQDPRLAL